MKNSWLIDGWFRDCRSFFSQSWSAILGLLNLVDSGYYGLIWPGVATTGIESWNLKIDGESGCVEERLLFLRPA